MRKPASPRYVKIAAGLRRAIADHLSHRSSVRASERAMAAMDEDTANEPSTNESQRGMRRIIERS